MDNIFLYFHPSLPVTSVDNVRSLSVGIVFLFQSAILFAGNPSSPQPRVPTWAAEAVWYQIFPERFWNGDSSNDPRVDDIAGSWPHEEPQAWSVMPWTSDWYEQQSWEKTNGKPFYHHVQQRRYGGDLQGVIDRLDYLSDLGVTALYFNPLFESPSLHKYDATMYHHIDNNFGPDPDGDRNLWQEEDPGNPSTWKWSSADTLFLSLIQKAHDRGMKIIIDGVFNHVGMTFWAFEDVKKNGKTSPYTDWFTITRWDDPATPADEFEYQGWYGIRELPEVREDSLGLAAGPAEHVRSIVRRWMDPNGDGDPSDGVDGWRLDVAEKVALPFWKRFRTWVREVNPEAYTVGEVWWEDWEKDKMFNAAEWLQGDAFDAVMNYRWAREACNFFVNKEKRITASVFAARIEALLADYPDAVNHVLMNLFDSHDTDRLSSRIVNPDMLYDHRVGLSDNPDYDIRKPDAAEMEIQKLMVVFQMTSLGAATVYYGDEAGMWGGDDPDERKPMLWPELRYDPEKSHPFGKTRPADSNEFNHQLFNHYRTLIGIRKSRPELLLGNFSPLLAYDHGDVFGFTRSLDSSHSIIVLNNSSESRDVQLKLPGNLARETWTKLFGEHSAEIKNGVLSVTLSPKSGAIFGSVN